MSNTIKKQDDVFPIELIEKLAECNRKLFSQLDAGDVYQEILENSFCLIAGCRLAMLFIINLATNDFDLMTTKAIDDSAIRTRTIRRGNGIAGQVAQSGSKKIINDPQQCLDLISESIITQQQINSVIYLPLTVLKQVVGILVLYLNKSKPFSRLDNIMIDVLAGHAAIAIQNANLYKRLQHDCEDMDLVIRIAQEITSTLDLDQVLENILKVSQLITNTDISFIWYRDLTTKNWRRVFPKNFPSQGLDMPNIENGEGIIGQVLKTGQYYLCNDATKDAYYYKTWEQTKSEIAIPIVIDNEVNGILNIESANYNAFSERHLSLLSLLAGQAAISLRNAQLYEIAERKTLQFITLKEIGEALSQQRNLNEILEIIARESLNLVGSGKKVCFVMLIDKEKNMLETKAAYGDLLRAEHWDFHIPPDQKSIVTWVVRNEKLRIAPDVSKDSEYLNITPETRSEICIPLFFRNEVIGVIDIESSELNAFNDQDVELLQTFADNTAIGTKIGELCDIRLKQLEALYNTGTKISSSLDLDEVLNTIAVEALKAIGNHNRILFVQLLDDEHDVLEIKQAYGFNTQYDYIGTKIACDKGISGWVIRNQKHYLCPNTKSDPYYFEIDPRTKSELCVPIMFGDKVIGLINVESLRENDFGQHNVHLLQQLANQAGVAIKNARLAEELADTQFQLTEVLGITMVSEALAGLTHDIRTASSLISGETQWIEYQYENKRLKLKEVIASMKKIEAQVTRIELMTNDLLEKSQQQPPQFVSTNLADITRSSVHLTSSYARRKKVDIQVKHLSLQFMAQVDVGRLKRVFINLIKNAIEAMPGGGKIAIWAKCFDDYFDMFFSDNGQGIAREDLKKIWTPFFSRKRGGAGFGLPNCKRIIETDHNGKISIKSSKGRGTTIRIRLPYQQQI